jgi:hypothetical protein
MKRKPSADRKPPAASDPSPNSDTAADQPTFEKEEFEPESENGDMEETHWLKMS